MNVPKKITKTAINAWKLNQYVVLDFDFNILDIECNFRHLLVDGTEYEPVIAYDMLNSIGIKSEKLPKSLTVVFCE